MELSSRREIDTQASYIVQQAQQARSDQQSQWPKTSTRVTSFPIERMSTQIAALNTEQIPIIMCQGVLFLPVTSLCCSSMFLSIQFNPNARNIHPHMYRALPVSTKRVNQNTTVQTFQNQKAMPEARKEPTKRQLAILICPASELALQLTLAWIFQAITKQAASRIPTTTQAV